MEEYYLLKDELQDQLKNAKHALKIEKQLKSQAINKSDRSHNEKLTRIEQENNLFLRQLYALQEELEGYYIKDKHPINYQNKKIYGADERIKQQLSYRLGTVIIEKSKSFSGMIFLPITLLSVKKAFNAEKKGQINTLPPLNSYADKHDAQRIKKHLSYRLGHATILTMKSPFGLVKLPFILRKVYREFKKESENV